MARGKSYTIAGVVYPRQADLEAAVKAALNSHPFNFPFEDAFLAAVINAEHQEVREAGQRATGRFEYLDFGEQLRRGMDTAERYRGGNKVMGWFEPLGDWRDVTVYPWRGRGNHRGDVKRALREISTEFLPHPMLTDFCVHPGCGSQGARLEYHHVAPEFDEMAERAMALMTPEEIEARFGYRKFEPGQDELSRLIPRDHPAVQCLVDAHESNIWEWLCAKHHRGVGLEP
jgi:hypothetical protein